MIPPFTNLSIGITTHVMKLKTAPIIVAFALFMPVFLAACGDERSVEGESARAESGSVSYAQIRAELLEPYCLRCHDEFGTKAGFADVLEAGHAESSEAVLRIESAESGYKMPPKGARVPEAVVAKLKRYVDGLK